MAHVYVLETVSNKKKMYFFIQTYMNEFGREKKNIAIQLYFVDCCTTHPDRVTKRDFK